jgi:hypothetical protein
MDGVRVGAGLADGLGVAWRDLGVAGVVRRVVVAATTGAADGDGSIDGAGSAESDGAGISTCTGPDVSRADAGWVSCDGRANTSHAPVPAAAVTAASTTTRHQLIRMVRPA